MLLQDMLLVEHLLVSIVARRMCVACMTLEKPLIPSFKRLRQARLEVPCTGSRLEGQRVRCTSVPHRAKSAIEQIVNVGRATVTLRVRFPPQVTPRRINSAGPAPAAATSRRCRGARYHRSHRDAARGGSWRTLRQLP